MAADGSNPFADLYQSDRASAKPTNTNPFADLYASAKPAASDSQAPVSRWLPAGEAGRIATRRSAEASAGSAPSALGDVVTEAIKGVPRGVSSLATNVVLKPLELAPLAYDIVHNTVTGDLGRPAEDLYEKYILNPQLGLQAQLAPNPNAGTAGAAANQLGGFVPDLAAMALTKNPTAAPEVMSALRSGWRGGAGILRDALRRSAEVSGVPAASHGAQTAADVMEHGGTPTQAAAAGLGETAMFDLANAAPLNTPGGIVKRVLQGGAGGTAGNVASQAVVNPLLPESMQADPLSAQNLVTGGGMSAVLAALLGPRASGIRLPRAAPSVTDALREGGSTARTARDDKALQATIEALRKTGASEADIDDFLRENTPEAKPASESAQPPDTAAAVDKPLAPEVVNTRPKDSAAGIEEPKTSQPEPAPEDHATQDNPVREVSLSDIAGLDADVPQFKKGAGETGEVEPLQGGFDRRGLGPIQLWQRNDGRMTVISGRHRYQHAIRTGQETIPAQVYREADGFTKDMAASLDAELNIRDGQGSVADYAQYFQRPAFQGPNGRQEAESRGLLARATGRRAYTIARQGDAELIAAHRAGQITDEQAVQIAQAAPNDQALQALGLQRLQQGDTLTKAANVMRAAKSMRGDRPAQQGDIFGLDDSAMRDASAMADAAAKRQRDIGQRLAAISGAAKRPEVARAEGIDVHDPEAVRKRIEDLRAERDSWENWETDSAKVAQLRNEAGLEAMPERAEPEAEPAPSVDDQTRAMFARNRRDEATGDLLGGGRGTNERVATDENVAGNQKPRAAGDESRRVDESTGLPLNDDGTVTVYHHTSPEAAAEIRRTGVLRAKGEPDVYVTTRAETDTGYGDSAVPIRVDPRRLQLDDEFPNGRRDFRLSVGRPGGSIKVDVSNDRTAPGRAGAPSRDLFGGPSNRDRLGAAERAKDAQRNGRVGGREDTGDGGLFDGQRPEQADIERPAYQAAHKSESVGTGSLSAEEVDRIASGVLGADAVKANVHTVASFEKLPEAVRKAAEAEGVGAGDINAVHWKGHSYILADMMRSTKAVREAVFHELYTHGGLRAKYKNALEYKLHHLLDGIGGVDGVLRMAKKQKIDLSEYVKAKDPPTVLMEELMAHMSALTGTLKRIVEEYVGAVRDFLRRRGIKGFDEIGVTDLAHVLKQARQAARESMGLPKDRPMFQRVFHGGPHRGIENEGFKLNKIGSKEVGSGQSGYAVAGSVSPGSLSIADYLAAKGDGFRRPAQSSDALTEPRAKDTMGDGDRAVEDLASVAGADGDIAAARKAWAEQGADSPYFRKWFKDSKAVDADGQPLTLYHGTADDFNAFDNGRLGENTGHMTSPLGHFLTEDRRTAKGYADKAAGYVEPESRVIDAYLSMQNPKEMTAREFQAIDSFDEARALRAKLEAEGYDGIHIPEYKQWVAFKPEQIKSASANRGTFDPENSDIRFSRKASEEPRERADSMPRGGSGTAVADVELPPRAPGESPRAFSARVLRENREPMLDGLKRRFGLRPLSAESKQSGEVGKTVLRAYMAGIQRAQDQAEQAFAQAMKVFDRFTQTENLAQIHLWETGQEVTSAAHRLFFKAMEKTFAERIDAIHELHPEALQSLIENYFPHIWKDPLKAREWYAANLAKKPLQGDRSFLKQRVYATIAEGMRAGLKPISTNPVDLFLGKIIQMDKFIAFGEMRNEIADLGMLREMKAGERVPYGYARVDSPAFEKAAGLQGYYAVPEVLARDINNYLSAGLNNLPGFRALRWTQNLTVMAQLGWSGFHAGFTTYDNLVLHAEVGLRQAMGGHFKDALLAWAKTPLSVVMSPLEGGRFNKEWLGLRHADVHTTAVLYGLEQGGARWKMSRSDYNDDLKQFIRAFRQRDVGGTLANTLGAFGETGSWLIHHKLVPAQKMSARVLLAKFELDRVAGKLGKQRGNYAGIIEAMTPTALRQLMGRVVKDVDSRLGQMSYDNLLWNRSLIQIGQTLFRALGWQIGTIETVTGGVRDVRRLWNPEKLLAPLDKAGTITDANMGRVTGRLSYLITLATVSAASNIALQLALTGEWPSEAKDLFFPKTGRSNANGSDERIQMPSYWMDHYKIASHPLQTAGHKINPVFGIVMEAINNQDFWGTQIRDPHARWDQQAVEVMEHFANGFMPFTFSNAQKIADNGGGKLRQGMSFFGITDAPASVTRSKFQAFVAHNGNKGFGHELMTKEDAKHRRQVKDVIHKLRNGAHPDMSELTHRDLLRVRREVPFEDPELQFRKMSIEDKLQAWQVASPEERKRYHLRRNILLSRGLTTDRFRRLPEDERRAIVRKVREIRAVQ